MEEEDEHEQRASWLVQNVDNQGGKMILLMKFFVEFEGQYQLAGSKCRQSRGQDDLVDEVFCRV